MEVNLLFSRNKRHTGCENSNKSNATETLRNLRFENPNRIMTGQLNITSIKNKFEMLTSLITNKKDVLFLSETKVDKTFPLEQFLISGFAKPLRLNRNSKGGVLCFSLEMIFLSGC